MLKSLVLVFLFSAVSEAEIYKWIDKKGQIQYGDKPLHNAQQLNVYEEKNNVKSTSAKQRQKKRSRLLESFAADRKEKNKKQLKIRKKQKRLQKSCMRSRDRLRQYQRARSLYNLDSKGGRITLSDKQRTNTTRKLKASIRRYCK